MNAAGYSNSNKTRLPALFMTIVTMLLRALPRKWLAKPRVLLRAAALLLGALLITVPRAAGTRTSLEVPLYLGYVELRQREPALLLLELPAGDYEVTPASLGYFIAAPQAGAPARFVYTAEVPRGLIYGQRATGAVVVEISAPLDSEAFINDHLKRIRERVAELNRRENTLRQERGRHEQGASKAQRLADELWSAQLEDVSALPPARWMRRVLGQDASYTQAVLDALNADSGYRTRLKEQFYAVQVARVDVWLAQFDLQLALAGIPEPKFSELLSLGDSSMVRQSTLTEIERLRTAWVARQQDLLRHTAVDRQWCALHDQPNPAPVAPQPNLASTPNGEVLRTRSYGLFMDPLPRQQVELCIVHQRLAVGEAELAQISAALAALEQAEQHVLAGQQPRPEELPQVELRAAQLREPQLERLAQYSAVEQAACQPASALELLLKLTREFSGTSHAVIVRRSAVELAHGSAYYPDELCYGVLAVDRCLAGPAGWGGNGLAEQLDAVLAAPADKEMAAYDLGLLKLLRWYAGLARDNTAARLFRDVARTARDQTAGAQSQ